MVNCECVQQRVCCTHRRKSFLSVLVVGEERKLLYSFETNSIFSLEVEIGTHLPSASFMFHVTPGLRSTSTSVFGVFICIRRELI